MFSIWRQQSQSSAPLDGQIDKHAERNPVNASKVNHQVLIAEKIRQIVSVQKVISRQTSLSKRFFALSALEKITLLLEFAQWMERANEHQLQFLMRKIARLAHDHDIIFTYTTSDAFVRLQGIRKVRNHNRTRQNKVALPERLISLDDPIPRIFSHRCQRLRQLRRFNDDGSPFVRALYL